MRWVVEKEAVVVACCFTDNSDGGVRDRYCPAMIEGQCDGQYQDRRGRAQYGGCRPQRQERATQAGGEPPLAAYLSQNRLAEIVGRAVVGGAVADERSNQAGRVQFFQTSMALAQVLAQSLTLCRTQAIVQEIFELLPGFVTRHGESLTSGAGDTTVAARRACRKLSSN